MNSSARDALAAASTSFSSAKGRAIGDVVENRVVEEEGVLRDDADLVAQRGQLQVANIFAVDPYAAGGDIVHALHQIRERRFAATAGADQCHDLAGFHFQIDVSSEPRDRGRPGS